ncbi:hypothetical protein PI124_g8441 [Phytophthora idaei]|nr:hypothetical protein PI124_g8441 [Phytophthora idaei]
MTSGIREKAPLSRRCLRSATARRSQAFGALPSVFVNDVFTKQKWSPQYLLTGIAEARPALTYLYKQTPAPTVWFRSGQRPFIAVSPPHVRYRGIWSGSDSDFVPSPKPPVGNDSPASKWGVKRRKAVVTSTSGKKNAASVTKSNARADEFLARASPSQPRYPRSELVVPLSIRHARKAGTADDVWDLIHTLDEPYKKQNPWKPSGLLYRITCLLCCDSIKGRTKTNRYSWAEALRNTKHSSNAKDRIKSKHVARPLAILAEQMTTEKSKTDIVNTEADVRAVLALLHMYLRLPKPRSQQRLRLLLSLKEPS